MKIHAPRSHPRYLSNYYRDRLAWGVEHGITSLQGLTAHGRGETFDYLLGETTHPFARRAIQIAAMLLIQASHPIISVNGNTAALVPDELIALAKSIPATLEVNLFHASKDREQRICSYLRQKGATTILLPEKTTQIPGIESNRAMISPYGQKQADVIMVPLEDGDRTQALKNMGKTVITIDLNPLSRTAQAATVTIVDHIARALPLLQIALTTSRHSPIQEAAIHQYDNQKALEKARTAIQKHLRFFSKNRS